MLHRLEAADRTTELLAHARVGDAHVERRFGDARKRRGIEQTQSQELRRIETRDRLAERGGRAQMREPEPMIDLARLSPSLSS